MAVAICPTIDQGAEHAPSFDLQHPEPTAIRSLGAFGAPHFTVGNELLWGDDRLDDAILWAPGKSSLDR